MLIQSSLIGQCFVYGDSLQSALVAIVVPDEEAVRSWARNHGDEGLAQAPFGEICKSDVLKSTILSEINALSKAGNLNSLETVKAIHLDPEHFSVENGLLTPTFKMKRKQIKDNYEREIESLYATLPPPKSKL